MDIGIFIGIDERFLFFSFYIFEIDIDMEGFWVFENDEECDVEEILNND